MADKLKLVAAMLVLAIGIGGFYYFGDKPAYLRWLMALGGLVAAAAVAYQAAPGKAAWEFGQASYQELRRVVWPTRKETIQMTLVVFALVVVVAIFLWAVDWGLLKLVKLLTGRGT